MIDPDWAGQYTQRIGQSTPPPPQEEGVETLGHASTTPRPRVDKTKDPIPDVRPGDRKIHILALLHMTTHQPLSARLVFQLVSDVLGHVLYYCIFDEKGEKVSIESRKDLGACWEINMGRASAPSTD